MKPISYFVDLPDAIADHLDSMTNYQKVRLAKGLLQQALDKAESITLANIEVLR
jgi:hypothetical protein